MASSSLGSGDTSTVPEDTNNSFLLISLPEELVSKVLSYLPAKDLLSAEGTCTHLRAAVVEGRLWARQCCEELPSLQVAFAGVDSQSVAEALQQFGTACQRGKLDQDAYRESCVFKRLLHQLRSPSEQLSLVAHALAASSTDNPQEGCVNVMHPRHRDPRFFNRPCYWSSTGTDGPERLEALSFQLAHPLCLVREIHVRPFRAYFQTGFPIYSSKAVQVRLGRVACYGPDGATSLSKGDIAAAAEQRSEWDWVSPEYPMAQEDTVQVFRIPPTLCVGGHLQLDLLGRVQRQSVDERFYICLCYVKVVGTPLHHFGIRDLGTGGKRVPAALFYNPQDLLQQAGGLRQVTEGGRLSRHAAALCATPTFDWAGYDPDFIRLEAATTGTETEPDDLLEDDDEPNWGPFGDGVLQPQFLNFMPPGPALAGLDSESDSDDDLP